MSHTAPGEPSARGTPLLVTAELPADVFAWADDLRRRHYPPERNRMGAHVTLFHALPPSADAETRRLLAAAAQAPPPAARLDGVMDLGRGTAILVASAELVTLHARLAEQLHGVIQQRDARPLRLHVTVQNKVARTAATALQAQLARGLPQAAFRFRGLALHVWRDELWQPAQLFRFRGQG